MDTEKQYDRFLDQLREEVKELYWLYNFFFLVEGILIGYAINKLPIKYNLFFYAGIFLSIFWFWIFRKQILWRQYWIKKVQSTEEKIGIPEDLRFFIEKKSNCCQNFFEFIFYQGGIAKAMYFLPLGFLVVWIYYYFWL